MVFSRVAVRIFDPGHEFRTRQRTRHPQDLIVVVAVDGVKQLPIELLDACDMTGSPTKRVLAGPREDRQVAGSRLLRVWHAQRICGPGIAHELSDSGAPWPLDASGMVAKTHERCAPVGREEAKRLLNALGVPPDTAGEILAHSRAA